MNDDDVRSISKALLYACWYLDAGTSFSPGMRHETLDGIVDLISEISPEAKDSLTRCVESLAEEYRDKSLNADLRRSLTGFLQVAFRDKPEEGT
jgi:hypothetical protein